MRMFCLAEISEIIEVTAFQCAGAVLSACSILFLFVEDYHTLNLSTWNQSEPNVSVTHKCHQVLSAWNWIPFLPIYQVKQAYSETLVRNGRPRWCFVLGVTEICKWGEWCLFLMHVAQCNPRRISENIFSQISQMLVVKSVERYCCEREKNNIAV